jgi:hypothetical protein
MLGSDCVCDSIRNSHTMTSIVSGSLQRGCSCLAGDPRSIRQVRSTICWLCTPSIILSSRPNGLRFVASQLAPSAVRIAVLNSSTGASLCKGSLESGLSMWRLAAWINFMSRHQTELERSVPWPWYPSCSIPKARFEELLFSPRLFGG